MPVLAGVLYLLLAVPAPASRSSTGLPCSAVPFDVNKVVARAGSPHVRGMVPPSFDSTEFIIDTTASGYNRKTSRAPAVAFNGENYLVVWTDDSLRGIIVSPSGIPDNPGGFEIAAVSGVDPMVAACGADFLVVWQQGYSPDIYGARVSGSGIVQDPNGFVISNARDSQCCPSVAANDSIYLVAWHDNRVNGKSFDIYAARVMSDRTVLDTQGLVVAACSSVVQARKQMYPDVASDGTDFLVAWESNLCGGWDIRYARVTDSGAVLNPGGVLLTKEGEDAKSASVAFDGNNYLVVWRRGPDASADIAGKRVTPRGAILDREPIVVSSAAGLQESPDVAFDDSNYVVTWQDSRSGAYDIYCARVTPAGSVLDPEGLPVTTARNDQESPALAFGTDKYLATWLDWRNSQSKPHVYGTMVNRSGVVVGPDVVIPYPESVPYYCTQSRAAAAFDGTNYLVVWQDSQPGASAWDIRGARVSPTGEVLDVPPIHISSDTDYQWSPAVAFGGSEYFVTWQDRRFGANSCWTIYGARVTASGTVLDTDGILIQRRQGYNIITPAVAFDGTNFLVLWDDGWTYARFINQAGQFLDSTPFPVNSGQYEKKRPCATYGNECYLVAWNDYDGDLNEDLQVGTMRVSRLGGRLDTGDVFISNWGMQRTSVTCDGQNFMVIWQDDANSNILAGRVAGQGGILPPQSYAVCTGPGQVSYPSVAFDGENYVAAWQDDRNGNPDIYGAKMNRSLTECDTFTICRRPGAQTAPVLTRGPGNQILVAFAGDIDSGGGQRIWGKVLSVAPMPPALLWPPNGYWFGNPPAWLLADTALHLADSFGFRVFMLGGDTIWTQVTSAPCCTIPDTVLANCTYGWQCRIHDPYGWSRYSTQNQFNVHFPHPAVAEPRDRRPLAFWVQSVAPKQGRAVTFRLSGVAGGAAISVLDAAGRLVRVLKATRDGPLFWDLENAAGRRAGVGVYFARLTTDGHVLTRKFVLTN